MSYVAKRISVDDALKMNEFQGDWKKDGLIQIKVNPMQKKYWYIKDIDIDKKMFVIMDNIKKPDETMLVNLVYVFVEE